MTIEQQLKLQAWLDGELPEAERRAVEASLAQDAEGAALLAELRHTNGALAGFEGEVKLPESREFYWSKIEREIQRQEQPRSAAGVPGFEFLAGWRRFLVPVGAVAALALLLIGSQTVLHNAGPSSGIVAAFVDEHAFTYRDQSQGTTLVWLSYAADDNFQEGDSEDTIQD
jgi:anti-sigma factor RsiW